MSKETTVDFYGRSVKGEEVAPGVIRRATRKNSKSYLVHCSVTDKWCYSSPERLDKLVKRYGSTEEVGKQYISREGKAQIKEQAEAVTTDSE
jgi:hypothetical protein